VLFAYNSNKHNFAQSRKAAQDYFGFKQPRAEKYGPASTQAAIG
jgi:hypothetical protein